MQPVLGNEDYRQFAALIHQLTGINLGEGKRQLLSTRLGKRLRVCKIENFHHYRQFVTSDKGREELTHMIDAVSTNKTGFFREPSHFQYLQHNVIPKLGNAPLRIWSSACSSGEEPYTIAMVLSQCIPNWQTRDIKILASDISTRILETARTGVYTRMAGIPPTLLRASFLKGQNTWNGHYLIRDELKKMIRFRYMNLMEPFPFTGKFDVIFCRNVMIYFNKETQAKLVSRLASSLKPGGYLFVGHSECLAGIARSCLTYIKPAIYRLN